MIPPFLENGYLPPGLHVATIDEIAERFGRDSELRRIQMESVRWMADLAVRAGAERIVLNGSFVTDIMEPNDVDCVLLFPLGRNRDPESLQELKIGLPFLEISMVDEEEFDVFVNEFFRSDRWGNLKGMIELTW